VGGIESFVLAMAQRLGPASVVVHTARQAGDDEFDAGLPFPVVRDPSRIMLPTPAITRRVAATARRYGCDSVWFGAAAPLGLMASRLRRYANVRRTVATTHGHEVWWAKTPGARQLLRRIGDTNDVLTYVAEFTRAEIAKALSRDAAEAMVRLTPGVDTGHFNPKVEASSVLTRYGLVGRRVVLCVSRLVERKGQDVLVEAWPLVRHAVPDAALLIVGDGPMRDKLYRRVAELGLDESVVFTGPKPWRELPAFFASGDVFCMPTRTRKFGLEVEALGIVYLEAAATGLPIVVGESGGAPDTVVNGETGFLVDGSDPRAVADRLIMLLNDPELAARLGAAGRRMVVDDWQWSVVVERLATALDPMP
jgi:phosphatidylinositol alpha-1,6-mannosyltransferase